MRIIEKYIISEILRLFYIVLASVVGIYLMVDFFEKIDNFISSGVGPTRAVLIFVYNIPLVLSQVLPFALLITVLISLGLMSRRNEIVALKSNGISMVLLLKPIIFLGLALTGILFLISEIIVPITVPKANAIWMTDVKKKQMVTTREKNIWIRGSRHLIYIKHYNPEKGMFFDLSIYFFDDDFNLVRRVDAASGKYTKEKLTLFNVMEQIRDPGTGEFKTNLYDEKEEMLGISYDDLKHVSKKSEEMNFAELREYIKKLQEEGYDASTFRVDLYAKTAFPFVCAVLCLVGTGIGLRRSIREGLPAGVAYGIGITFLYWVFNSFCLSLGYGGFLPPIVAAWMANGVFLCWGAYLFLANAFEA